MVFIFDFTGFEGIIFDMDGTLINSSHVWSNIDKEFLNKRGFDVPADYYKKVSTLNFDQGALYTIGRFKLSDSPEDVVAEWHSMAEKEYATNVFIKDNADEFLRYIKSLGIKIALATASTESLYTPVLKNNGIYDMFDFFATTAQVKRAKGYPDVYEFACEGISSTPSKCAVFEDIIEGIRGAKAGNFTAVACLDDHYIADWADMKNESDHYFKEYRELL